MKMDAMPEEIGPMLHLDSMNFPEIMDWEVGKKYIVVFEMKQMSKDMSRMEGEKTMTRAGFELMAYKHIHEKTMEDMSHVCLRQAFFLDTPQILHRSYLPLFFHVIFNPSFLNGVLYFFGIRKSAYTEKQLEEGEQIILSGAMRSYDKLQEICRLK